MALLVDGGITTIAVLKEHDTGVFETAAGEGIDLGSKLRLAEAEIRADVERFLARMGRGSLARVAATDSMRLWHAWKTLEAVYRDAYFSQLNDRYGARWKHYKAMAADQRGLVLEEGIGLVGSPIGRPIKPTVSLEAGLTPPGGYNVRVSALNTQGEESEASESVAVTSDSGFMLRITMDWLPSGASGWLVYAGPSEKEPGLQTTSPVNSGGEFVLNGPLASGRPPGRGQEATEWVLRSRVLR